MNFSFFFAALAVALGHMVAGILIFVEPATIKVTPLAYLQFAPADVVGGVLIGASVLVTIAFWHRFKTWVTLLLLLPQQFILALSLVSVIVAVATGTYPDGYVPHGRGLFILNDQVWMLIICVWHTVEYITAQRRFRFNLL